MEIRVTGLELRDIPDVILLPGRIDSLQIGSLNQYIQNTLSPVDSISWSFEPAEFDSLEIRIDPETRRVMVIPEDGWTGRRRIVWTATEAQGLLPGNPPLTATEVSDIVVNHPPTFIQEPGYQKRRFVLEQGFSAGDFNKRAFKSSDLFQDIRNVHFHPSVIGIAGVAV